MNKIKNAIKQFKSVIPAINEKYRPHEQVIKLFAERKIEKTKEAKITRSTRQSWNGTADRH